MFSGLLVSGLNRVLALKHITVIHDSYLWRTRNCGQDVATAENTDFPQSAEGPGGLGRPCQRVHLHRPKHRRLYL